MSNAVHSEFNYLLITCVFHFISCVQVFLVTADRGSSRGLAGIETKGEQTQRLYADVQTHNRTEFTQKLKRHVCPHLGQLTRNLAFQLGNMECETVQKKFGLFWPVFEREKRSMLI